jgi:hypothetical protein
MRFACLSLAVFVLASLVASGNVWESDANQYQEVMKHLEKENLEAKKSVEQEAQEQKKGNVEYLSTFFITHYQTWIKSGADNVNGQLSSWTSSHISSIVTSHVSTFHGNEKNIPAFTSLYTSLYTQVYTKPPQYVIETHVGNHGKTKERWSTKFNLANCDCKEKFLSADKWLGVQLKKWEIKVRPLKQKSQSWFKKNKRIGKWWIREVKDDRYEQWIKWVKYLENLRVKHISMGGKKFNQIFKVRVNAHLNKILKQLGKRLISRVTEAKKYLTYKIVPQFKYKSTTFKQYRLLAANLWRRTQKAKFGSVYLRLYRTAHKWYKSQPKKIRCLWKSYKRVYLNLYKHYIGLMKPWYKAMLKTKSELSLKYLRRKWRIFIRRFVKRLKSFVKKAVKVISFKVKRVKGKRLTRRVRIMLVRWLRRQGGKVRACKRKMIRSLRKVVKTSNNIQLVKKILRKPIISIKHKKNVIRQKGLSKFSKKVCRCTRRFLFANDWLSKQLNYWDVSVKSIKKDIKKWYNQNKKVGRWWLLQAEDHVHQLWIEWTRFLYEMRKKCIRVGSVKFVNRFLLQVRNKLIQLLTVLRGRLSTLVNKGYTVMNSLKNPLLKVKLTKLLNYQPRFKKAAKLISARIWQLREAAKFKSVISNLRKTVKTWSKKNQFNAKWWKAAHERLLNTAFKQYKKLEKVYLREIQRKGYVWYKKQGESKWKKTVQVLKAKVKPLNKTFLTKSRILIREDSKKVSPAVKAKFLKAAKAINRGYILLSTKLQRKLKRVVTKGLYDYIKIVEKPVKKTQKKDKWSLSKRPKLPTKFKIRTCNCDKRTIAANAWFGKQLRRWDSATEKWQRKIHFFHVRNKRIGKWWLYESEDDVFELWIQWVWYLDNLRKMRVFMGTAKFGKSFEIQLNKRLNTLVGKLRERVLAQLADGRSAYAWKKHPAYKAKLALLQKYRPRFRKSYRLISSNIWLREESGRFGAFLLRLYRSAKSIHKISHYRKLINVIYKRYHQLLRIYARGIRRHGYIWHLKASNNIWRLVKRSFYRKVASIHKKVLAKASRLLVEGGSIHSASTRVSLQDCNSLEIRHFNRFATKVQNKIRRLVAKKWIRHITKDRWKGVKTTKISKDKKKKKKMTKKQSKIRVNLKKTKKSKVTKQVKIREAKRWLRKENVAFVGFIRQLHKKAKSWHKQEGKKIKGWLKIYTKILRTAAKAHKSLTGIVSKLIKKHGYSWYLKHGQKKYQKSKTILRKKTKLIHKIVIAKSKALVTKKQRINLAVVKKQLTGRVKTLLKGFVLLSTKLKLRLKPLFKLKVQVSLKNKKSSSSSTVKFQVRTCNCRRKFITANKWISRQIKKFSKLSKTYRKRLLAWFNKHKKIGKWWLLKGLDAIDEIWIEHVSFLEELRESAIALGPVRFQSLYKSLLQAKLRRNLVKIQRRVVAQIKKGRKVLRQMKNPAFKSKLARLRHCTPKYQMTKRILLANVWRRNVRAKFRAYLLRLNRITHKWFKKQSPKVKWAVKLYRPVINKVYTNFLRVLNSVHATVKRHGFKWFKKSGREKFTSFLQKSYNSGRRLTRVVMQKSRKILTLKTGASFKELKKKLRKQLVTLMKQTEREGRLTAKKMKKFLTRIIRKMKHHQKTKQVKINLKLSTKKAQTKRRGYFLLSTSMKRKQRLLKSSQGVFTQKKQKKCRVTDADLLGGSNSLMKARKCLLTQLSKKKQAKKFLNRQLPRPALAAKIWKECENLKFKALLKRLIISAKKWYIKSGKKLRGFLKFYKQILRTARKAHFSLTNLISKTIKKRGYAWYLKQSQKTYKKAQTILRAKVQLIHRFVLGNAKVLVRNRHRINLTAAKKRLGKKINKLLRGYILLSTKLKRRVRATVVRTKTVVKSSQGVAKRRVHKRISTQKKQKIVPRTKEIKLKMKLPLIKKVKKRTCRITDADLLGGMKSLKKARKCLLTQLSKKKQSKKFLNRQLPRPALAAKIWKECENLKFKALLKRLIISAKKWYIKSGKKLRGFLKFYKQILRTARKAHFSLTNLISKTIKKRGYAWYLKQSQKTYKKAKHVLRAKVQLIHRFVLGNAKVLVRNRHRINLTAAKKRLGKKIKKLLRGYILLSTKLRRRVRATVSKQKKRHFQILRKLKIKVRPVVITKRDMELPPLPRVKKCRVSELDLMGGFKRLLKARKCLLTKLRSKKRGSILKLNVRRKTLVAEIWKRRENLKFKALLKRLIRSAKQQTKKLRGFIKMYKQIITTASKAYKSLTRQISAVIKKRGFRWYLRHGQKKYRQAQRILRNKVQLIHRFVLKKAKTLLRNKHRINLVAAKKQLNKRIKKLLRGYLLLSTKLKRRVRISLTKKTKKIIKKIPSLKKHRLFVRPIAKTQEFRVKIKTRPLIITKRDMELPPLPRVKKCRVRERDLTGGIRTLMKARKCLLTKLRRRRGGKKILKLNVRRRTLVAEIWKRRENLKFKAVLSRLMKSAKLWHKQQNKKLKGFIKMYKQILRTARKAYKTLTDQISAAIKKRGFRWYLKHGQKTYRKVQDIHHDKVTFIHQYVMGNAKALVKRRHSINLTAAKKRLNMKMKKLLRGYILLSTKLTRKVRRVVSIKKQQLVKKTKLRFRKVPSFVRQRKIKFSKSTCNCQKKYIVANKWVKRQLKKFQALAKQYKKRISRWYKKNKKIGKWWLRRALDLVNAAWIKWALSVEKRRITFLKFGSKKFNVVFRDSVRSKLATIFSKLQKKIKTHIIRGAISLQLRKRPPSALKFKPRAIRIRRLIAAKIWKRKQSARFGSYLLRLQKISTKWLKKQFPKSKWVIKLYRRAINKVYEGYLRNLKVMQKAIKVRGQKWYKRFACKKWRILLQVMYTRARRLTKLILQKTSRILSLKFKIPASVLKQKLRQQIKVMTRTTARLFKRLNRKLKIIVRRLIKMKVKRRKGQSKKIRKSHKKFRGSHKKRHIFVVSKLPPLPKIKVCLTDKPRRKHKKLGKGKKVGKVGKILRLTKQKKFGKGKFVKVSHKKQKHAKTVKLSKVNIRRRIVVAEIWRRRENARFKTFLTRLQKSAKSWHKREGKKLKGWLKIYQRIIRTASKVHKSLTNTISKLIKKRGYGWYLQHGQKKYKTSSKILHKKAKIIHKIVIVKSKALLTKKGRVNLQSVKKQLNTRVKKLLRGYILLSTKLQRKIKPLFKPKVVVTVKQKVSSTKLSGKTCNCRKKYISANKWVAKQIKKFGKLTRKFKQRLLQWYHSNKKIGKWWLFKGLDAIDEIWIEYVTFLEELRESAVALGSVRFQTLYKPLLRAKVNRILSKIRRRIVAHLKKGRKVLQQMKKSGFKLKLGRLRRCRRQFKVTKRILLANVWRRNVRADLRSYLLRLNRITQKWFKKQSPNVKWAVKFYRPVMNKVYTNFLRVLNTMHKTRRRYGFKWFKKYGQKKFRQVLQKTYNTARRLTRVVMQQSKRILKLKTRVSVGVLKRKLKQAITKLMKQIDRVGRVTAKKMKKFVKITVKKMKKLQKLKLKFKVGLKVKKISKSKGEAARKQKPRRIVRRGYLLLSTSAKRKKKIAVAGKKSKVSRTVLRRRKSRKSRCSRAGGEVKLPGLVIRRGLSGYFVGLNGLSFIVSEKPKKGNVVRFFGPLNVSGSLTDSSGCCVRTKENVILRGGHRGRFFKNGLNVIDGSARKRKCHCYK